VTIRDFGIGRSFRIPFEADPKLVVDTNNELACTAAPQRFQSVAAKGSQIFQASCGVEPDQPCSNLLFDVHQFNDALAVH
jgi:hypothetical protein